MLFSECLHFKHVLLVRLIRLVILIPVLLISLIEMIDPNSVDLVKVVPHLFRLLFLVVVELFLATLLLLVLQTPVFKSLS